MISRREYLLDYCVCLFLEIDIPVVCAILSLACFLGVLEVINC